MSHLELSDRDIERVFAGHQPPGRPDLAEVAFLIARLRTMGDFEQAPPMSPRLLAELDASEVERRDSDRPHHGAHSRRARTMRRRWQLVGAAAVATMVVGLLAAGVLGGDDGRRTEVAGDESGSSDQASQPVTTTVPKAPTTTVATTTTAPPTTQPQTTTTAATTTSTEAPEPSGDGMPTSLPPWPENGSAIDEDAREAWDDYCERHRWNDWCESYEDYRDGGGDGGQSSSPQG